MKIKNIPLIVFYTSLLLASITSVQAKDTEIYFPEGASSTSHNLLFVMDVSGSMRSLTGNEGENRFEAMKGALDSVLQTAPSSINVGIMNFGSIDSGRNDYAQGVKFPVSPIDAKAEDIFEDRLPSVFGMTNWSASNLPRPNSTITVRDYLSEVAETWSPQGWTPIVDSLYEAALYFRGEKVSWGRGPDSAIQQESWTANRATYTGSYSGWDAARCDDVIIERFVQGQVPSGTYCPSDPDNPGGLGSPAFCAATEHDCTSPDGGGGDIVLQKLMQEGNWNRSKKQSYTSSKNPKFTFEVTQQSEITMSLDGLGIDPWLYLLDGDGNLIESNDDADGSRNSRITMELAVGNYQLVASTYRDRQRGDFRIFVEGYVDNFRNEDNIPSATTTGEWTNSGGRHQMNHPANGRHQITVSETGPVTLLLESSSDTYLYLLDSDGNVVASDDDSGGSYNAKIERNLSAGHYTVVTTTYHSGVTDSYTLYMIGNVSESAFPEARYVRLVAQSEVNGNPWTSLAELNFKDISGNTLNQSGWSLVSVDSEETVGEDGRATRAFDGNINTFWHTEWHHSDPQHPHTITIDLGAMHTLSDMLYTPRQNMPNGRIQDYELYVSTDGSNWGVPVAQGHFHDGAATHTVSLGTDPSSTGSGSGSGSGGQKVSICHVPPGNPDNAHTIVVSVNALQAHLDHGDYLGACGNPDPSTTHEGQPNTCAYVRCAGGATTAQTYVSPITSECQSNSMILLSDGKPQYSRAIDVNPTYDKVVTENEWTGTLPDIFRGLNCADEPSGFREGRCGPELTDYLSKNDNLAIDGNQYIDTYTIGFGLSHDPNATAYLKSLATVDDPETADATEGYYSAEDRAELVTAFSEILQDVVSGNSNSSFSNPGYSIVAKTGLNHENSIFIPIFKVSNNVVWEGNLKKFEIANVNGERRIRGQNGLDAVNELGIFTNNAHDFWSTSKTADGEAIEHGGVASLLKDEAQRELYVDLGACRANAGVKCNLNLNDVNGINSLSLNSTASRILDADLGLERQGNMSENSPQAINERKQYICFARGAEGYDATNDECTGGPRKHMGDMLHFEPVVVTYDAGHSSNTNDDSHQQVIFAGTNEGYLHAFDTRTGEEIWGFMPRSLLKNIKPQFDNTEHRGHRYGVDGIATVWSNDTDGVISGNDFVRLIFGMRRGGNFYYALDVTNVENPKVLWKIEGGKDDFEHLGQSWSRPYIAKLRTGVKTLQDVIVFSGGFDTNQDKSRDGEDSRSSTDSVGNDVFIVDAETGDFIWSIKGNSISGHEALEHSVAGGVRLLDMDRDGGIDRMYFADVAGHLWRVDLFVNAADANDPYDPDTAQLNKLASLSGAGNDGEYRKFYNEPDVSVTHQHGKVAMLVSIGSGDRTNPLDTDVTNRFYVIKDPYLHGPVPPGAISGAEGYEGFHISDTDSDFARIALSQSSGSLSLGNALANSDSNILISDKRGWSFEFPGEGEKVLGTSTTSHGKLVFTTLVPDVYANGESSSSSCTGGAAIQGRLYALDILTGNPVVDLDGDGGDLDTNDLFVAVSANEIPGDVQMVFNEPTAPDGKSCSKGNCVQYVDFRVGKKLSQVHSYNAGVLESVSWSKTQKK